MPIFLTTLQSAQDLSKAKVGDLQQIFTEEKLAKQIVNAAKRVNKKRSAGETTASADSRKKAKVKQQEVTSPAQFEESIALPEPIKDEDQIRKTTLFTNRAPLVLAFAVTLLSYTMPEQPPSSRLSLAQAVVSVNSRSKAVSLGLESGNSAEEEGWGDGQPTVKVMGREIRVMKRWGYEWRTQEDVDGPGTEQVSQANSSQTLIAEEPALWALDLEALKKSNSSVNSVRNAQNSSQMPIYTAQSARSYLLKAFETASEESDGAVESTTKKTYSAKAAEKEQNLALLLGALELLYKSWAETLTKEEFNKRSWAWYMDTRPSVESGTAGWGGKNKLKLADILDLRKAS